MVLFWIKFGFLYTRGGQMYEEKRLLKGQRSHLNNGLHNFGYGPFVGDHAADLRSNYQ